METTNKTAIVTHEVTSLVGAYEGSYQDALGHEGKIRFILDQDEVKASGNLELIIDSDDEAHVFRSVDGVLPAIDNVNKKYVTQFNTKLQFEPNEANMKDKNAFQVEAEFNINIQQATPFAYGAAYGTVKLTGDPGLVGGVFIAWLFDKK